MTGDTRRGYLRALSSLALTGTARMANAATDTDTESSITARDLVLTESAVPDRFEQHHDTGSGQFLESLYAKVPALSTASTADTCYWYGGDQDNPHWVLSSFALVTDEPLPRDVIEDANRESTEAYVEAYDAETNSFVEFEHTHACGARTTDRRVDIIDTSGLQEPNNDPRPIFADLMRHQYFGNVLLSTLVFGPRSTPPALEAMLDEYARYQRIQYWAHGGGR